MIGQPIFFANGPEYISGDIYSYTTGNLGSSIQPFNDLRLTGSGYMDKLIARSISGTTAQITSITSNSGVFNYLAPTGIFFPPLLTFDQRTGYFSGYLTTGITPYDGMMCYQTTSGQKLMVVQSGMWKTATLV